MDTNSNSISLQNRTDDSSVFLLSSRARMESPSSRAMNELTTMVADAPPTEEFRNAKTPSSFRQSALTGRAVTVA